MKIVMTLVILAGPMLALVGCILAVYRIVALARGGHPKSAVRLAAVSLAVGFAGYLAGALLGAWALCSPAGASNLCGLGGVIGTGPLIAGILLIAFSQRLGKQHAAA